MALLPLQVHGALLDHHRLMRQFGAVPLMFITCLAKRDHEHDREDPHVGWDDPSDLPKSPPNGGPTSVRSDHKFSFRT
jgi:hypothetical protein